MLTSGPKIVVFAVLKWIATWFAEGISTLVARPPGPNKGGCPGYRAAGYFLASLKVKSTSLAVKGWPSDHLTPCRIVKVSVLRSWLNRYDVANQGICLPFAT